MSEALMTFNLFPPPEPAVFSINAEDGREIVRIEADGKVVVNPDFTVDEAARKFWDAVRDLRRLFAEDQP